jgi:Zinc knuckle
MGDNAARLRPGRGRSGARGGGRGEYPGRSRFTPKEPLNSDEAVPLLRCGPGNNFMLFKKRLSVVCMERYGDLGRIIKDEKYYEPPAVDISKYDSANDLVKELIKDRLKQREVDIASMRRNQTQMYAYIMSKLSKESRDELEREEAFKTHSASKDPLALWKDVKKVHMVSSVSKIDAVVKKTAKDDYMRCLMNEHKSILKFKQKFESKLEIYKAACEVQPEDQDIAMDFLYALDQTRYGEFTVNYVNNIAMGAAKAPKNLTEIFLLASRLVVMKKGAHGSGGATFATLDNATRKKRVIGKKGADRGNDKASDKQSGEKPKAGLTTTTTTTNSDKSDEKPKTEGNRAERRKKHSSCYNCGKKGHYSYECTKEAPDDDDAEMVALTMDVCCSTKAASSRLHKIHEVCLDIGSQVNILHSRLLTNIRKHSKAFKSMYGVTRTEEVGYLDGFFDCLVCDSCPTNILSMSDIEDKFRVTYQQGESITVHINDGEITFYKRDKMYVADFSAWLDQPGGRRTVLMTQAAHTYSKKEVQQAKEVGDFVKRAGYPSKAEAMHLADDGNLLGVPHTSKHVNDYFNIHGPSVEGVRGKTTNVKAVAAEHE